MALLGELHFLPLSPSATCHLPRGGGVAYAAQESWVLNATIKVRSERFGDDVITKMFSSG